MQNCKNCSDRHLSCHSTCSVYLDFRKRKDAENKKKKIENEQNFLCSCYHPLIV